MNLSTYFEYIINPHKIIRIIDDNNRLTKINRSKDKILANISHELKNPISAIRNVVYFLKDNLENNNKKDYIEYLDDIEECSNETLVLIEDLLDISHLNSGKLNVDLSKKIDLPEVIKRTISTIKNLYLQYDITFSTTIAEDIPLLYLDNRRLKQILVNLISNSIKYSKDKINVTILLNYDKSSKTVEIIISDNGIGMSCHEIEHALEEYQTIKHNNSKNIDAFGIGLPLVKYLVEKQNGNIHINSVKNFGTDVILKFNL